MLVDPRVLAGVAALVIAALLTLLYAYRRRTFILCWIIAWGLQGVGFVLAGQVARSWQGGWIVYGFSQLLGICGVLGFAVAADAYNDRLRIRPKHGYVLLPLAIWFVLAPAALDVRAAFVPGHLIVAGAFAGSAFGHLRLLRQTRMLGATIIGISFVGLAALNGWAAVSGTGPDSSAANSAVIFTAVLYLVTALGMQLMTFEDMTFELRRANRRLELAQAELRELAVTDTLTGCRNRRFFAEIIDRELRRHRRYELPLSLLFIDLDRFKTINDTLGHEAGDRVLRETAAFLVKHVRDADYVFRWGGDEFLIMITATEEEARRRGRELQDGFARLPELRELPPGVGLSLGCVQVPLESTDVMQIVQSADERMYENKKSRTGRKRRPV